MSGSLGGTEVSVVRPKENGVCGIDDGEMVEVDKLDEQDESEAGQRKTKKLRDPVWPKEDEVREHERAHLPLRSWCRHCV